MKKLLFLLALASSLLADELETHDIAFENRPTPWFTGPLIAPSGYTVPPGHFTLQPYFDTFVNVGSYDANWEVNKAPNFYMYRLRARFKAGITKWLDVQVTPQALCKETLGKSSAGFGDLLFGLNIQLLTYKIEDRWPSLKLILHTSIPMGKYQHLSLSKKRTDALGSGCWYPEVAFVLSKLWPIYGIHYLDARLFSGYRIGTATSVRGLNTYGGDRTTRGTAHPGNIFFIDAAFQYSLTQRWALACDAYYAHQNRTRFSGNTKAAVGGPSMEQFSLAPALEYNWSKNIGLIGGIWFSLAGRNTPQFINGTISLNAYF